MDKKINLGQYKFGEIEINGEKYTNDVIIFPNKIKDNWWRKNGHSIEIDDVEEVIDYNPEIFIIGRGKNGRLTVHDKFIKNMNSYEIEVLALKTPKAKKKFNKFLKESKDVVAGLHLTC